MELGIIQKIGMTKFRLGMKLVNARKWVEGKFNYNMQSAFESRLFLKSLDKFN
jgi:hypothetical protein